VEFNKNLMEVKNIRLEATLEANQDMVLPSALPWKNRAKRLLCKPVTYFYNILDLVAAGELAG